MLAEPNDSEYELYFYILKVYSLKKRFIDIIVQNIGIAVNILKLEPIISITMFSLLKPPTVTKASEDFKKLFILWSFNYILHCCLSFGLFFYSDQMKIDTDNSYNQLR